VVPALDRSSEELSWIRFDGRTDMVFLCSLCQRANAGDLLLQTGAAWRWRDDLEPIVLFDKAKPGDKVLVAVKLLHTVDTKTFGGTELKIDFTENRPQSGGFAPGVSFCRTAHPEYL